MSPCSDKILLLKIQACKRRGDGSIGSGNHRDAIDAYSEAVDMIPSCVGGAARACKLDGKSGPNNPVRPTNSKEAIPLTAYAPKAPPPVLHGLSASALKTTREILPAVLSNRSRAYCSAGR